MQITEMTIENDKKMYIAFDLIITGSQAEHFTVCAILQHMQTIAHFLFRHHITIHASVQAYIQSTAMDQDGTWGLEVEILTLSHLLQTNVYIHISYSYGTLALVQSQHC